MRTTRSRLLATFALAAASLLISSTAAQAETQLHWQWDYMTEKPGAPSAVYVEADATDPDDPNGKPLADTRFVVRLPGRSFDTTVPARCEATDDQLNSQGLGACPDASLVGTGIAASITGLGPPVDPLEQSIYAFNGDQELIMVVTGRNDTVVQAVLRAEIRRGRVIDVEIPQIPSPAGGTVALTIFHLKFERIVRTTRRGRSAYITTPEFCPRSDAWRIFADIDFVDGSHRRISDTSPCRSAR